MTWRIIKFSILLGISIVLLISLISGCSNEDKKNMKTYKEVLLKSPDRTRELALKENLKLIRNAIQIFMAQNDRYPESLEELAEEGIIDHLPPEPLGGQYTYNSNNGKVKSTSRPNL